MLAQSNVDFQLQVFQHHFPDWKEITINQCNPPSIDANRNLNCCWELSLSDAGDFQLFQVLWLKSTHLTCPPPVCMYSS